MRLFATLRKSQSAKPGRDNERAEGSPRALDPSLSVSPRSSRTAKPRSPRELPPSPESPPQPSNVNRSRESFEMKKRRVRVELAVLENPLMTESEFIVDVRYRSVRLVGCGSYGIVVSAIDSLTGDRVAIKKILSTFSTARHARHALREVRLLRHLSHPNIVRLLDIDVPYQYRAWNDVYIVTPLLQTDLRSALNARRLDNPMAQKKVSYHMLLALEHMHSLGLMHRDIKARNLLLDKENNAQLCDLGHSRFYSKATPLISHMGEASDTEDEPELTGTVTTMITSAPEIALGAPYDSEVDIWAAACVIAEILHPQHYTLFDLTKKQSHLQEIADVVGFPSDDMLDSLPDHGVWYMRFVKKRSATPTEGRDGIARRLGNSVDPLALDLLSQMLRFSPKKRISASKALAHAWFDDVRQSASTARETYDFATSEPHRKASRSEMKSLMWKEVVAFHPEARHLYNRQR